MQERSIRTPKMEMMAMMPKEKMLSFFPRSSMLTCAKCEK